MERGQAQALPSNGEPGGTVLASKGGGFISGQPPDEVLLCWQNNVPGTLYTLTTDIFEAVVSDWSKDVLVLFYGPRCPYSKYVACRVQSSPRVPGS